MSHELERSKTIHRKNTQDLRDVIRLLSVPTFINGPGGSLCNHVVRPDDQIFFFLKKEPDLFVQGLNISSPIEERFNTRLL